MDLTASYSFPAPPARVWTLLMDPAAIAGCIPGCESLEPDGEDRYRARLTVALAAITGTYDGTVVISNKAPYDGYTLTVEGQGKPGFVKGVANVALRPDGEGTTLSIAASLDAGGPIARVGQRLIGSVAKMMQDRFFACLKAKL